MRKYIVRYRATESWSDPFLEKNVLVTAYTAEDAAFQALVMPRLHNVFVMLLAVDPFQEGMKYDAQVGISI